MISIDLVTLVLVPVHELNETVADTLNLVAPGAPGANVQLNGGLANPGESI